MSLRFGHVIGLKVQHLLKVAFRCGAQKRTNARLCVTRPPGKFSGQILRSGKSLSLFGQRGDNAKTIQPFRALTPSTTLTQLTT